MITFKLLPAVHTTQRTHNSAIFSFLLGGRVKSNTTLALHLANFPSVCSLYLSPNLSLSKKKAFIGLRLYNAEEVVAWAQVNNPRSYTEYCEASINAAGLPSDTVPATAYVELDFALLA